ncbi:MAG: thermonuclease family protein [Bacillota bacterium]
MYINFNNKKLFKVLIIFVSILFFFTADLIAFSISEIDDDLKVKNKSLKFLEKVQVKKIIDGDTFVINNGEKVRLIGVDTPEFNREKDDKTRDFYAKRAAEYTRKWLKQKYDNIYLEYGNELKDEYDRLLAYVFLPDGTFFNARILKDGYAYLLTVPPNIKYVKLFKKTVGEARENKRGLWKKTLKEDYPVISPEKADEFMGEKVIVEGKVIDTHDSGEAIFLNFDKEYWNTFTGVIFKTDEYKFLISPEKNYLNSKVRILGTIQEYKGSPEIIIEQPHQIWEIGVK